MVRAALEAEKPSESNRFEERRRGDLFLIALSTIPYGEPALEYAEKLGEAGAALAATDPLPSPARVLESLRAVPCTIPQLRDDRLVRLAAAAAAVAVSPRLELYPRNLDSLRALKLAQSSLAGVAKITSEELRSRIHDRYPESQPLPDRPELDRLLTEAGLDLAWNQAQSAWLAPPPPGFPSSTSLHRFETVVAEAQSGSWITPVERAPAIEEAFEFERRLQAAYRAPSYLVLATEPRLKHLKAVQENLAKHFPMAVFDCEKEMIAAMQREAKANGNIRWDVILRADAAGPGTRDWEHLGTLASAAARRLLEHLRLRSRSTLVIYPGLLARYGQLAILDELADSLGASSLWLLTGSDRQSAAPMTDGQAIPARPTQWAWVPEKWLDNEFRLGHGGSLGGLRKT